MPERESVTLPTTLWGSPAAPRRALLVHGLGSNGATWWRVAEALRGDGWAVVAVDLRGHGDAPRASSYAIADYAGDLPGSGWDLVVGHSLGGAASVLAATPGFTRRLVLIDPVLDLPSDEVEAVRADQLAELDFGVEELRVAKPHWHERDIVTKAAAIAQVDAATVAASIDDNTPWNVVAESLALSVPTLIIGGDHSVYSMLPTAIAQRITDANPLVSYEIIVGAGHSPQRDRPVETLAVLRDWIGRTPGA